MTWGFRWEGESVAVERNLSFLVAWLIAAAVAPPPAQRQDARQCALEGGAVGDEVTARRASASGAHDSARQKGAKTRVVSR